MRAIVGKGIAGFGLAMALSTLVVNPWVGKYYQDYIENYTDVMLGYVWWGLGLGVLVATLGLKSACLDSERWTGAAILAATVSFVVLVDRALLVVFGLPNWIPDPVVGYRHRPSTVRVLGSRLLPSHNERISGIRYVINQHGHHDDDFPMARPEREFRGLMLGDSVTMGDGLERKDTAANQLEAILYSGTAASDRGGCQIINAGVGGYSTNHELAVFRESLAFSPDFVTVGLCLNDITDLADIDNQPFAPTHRSAWLLPSHLAGYLAHETGFSRLTSWALASTKSIEQRRSSQAHLLREMAYAPHDPQYESGLKSVLENLEAIYLLARDRGIDVVLLIYPFVSQLFAVELQKPQQIFLEHARAHGVDAIDLTSVFEELIRSDVAEIMATLEQREPLSSDDVELLSEFQSKRYYLDEVHPTALGNRAIAGILARYMHEKGLVQLDFPSVLRDQRRALSQNPGGFTINMRHTPSDVAQTAYILFLLQHDIEEIRHVIDIGIRSTDKAETTAKLYRLLGEIEGAMGNEKEAFEALQKSGNAASNPSVTVDAKEIKP